MRIHNLHDRILRAGLRVTSCRYRVVAIGFNRRGKIIGLRTNSPRLSLRGWHAEERLIHGAPPTLHRVVIARLGADGRFLPIDPCPHCAKLAKTRGIEIERY